MRRVLIIDTSVLCVWLEVPGKDSCGLDDDLWNKQRVDAKIAEAQQEGTLFVLPLASIIETGNHIAHANDGNSRRECGLALAKLMRQSADEEQPWAAFSDQSELWSPNSLKMLAETWPALVMQERLSLADATIIKVADFYVQAGHEVEILTGDRGLQAHEPTPQTTTILEPRRRQRR